MQTDIKDNNHARLVKSLYHRHFKLYETKKTPQSQMTLRSYIKNQFLFTKIIRLKTSLPIQSFQQLSFLQCQNQHGCASIP